MTPDESFTSYLNVEVRLVLQQVSLVKGSKIDFNRFKILNIYRDSDVMLSIQ